MPRLELPRSTLFCEEEPCKRPNLPFPEERSSAAPRHWPQLAVTPSPVRAGADARPNSKFNGVQIGVITYSYRALPGSAEDLLKYILQCGISSVELMGGPAEQFAGAYVGQKGGGKPAGDKQPSASMDGFKALRKLYNDAGVNIHIVKFGNIGDAGHDRRADRILLRSRQSPRRQRHYPRNLGTQPPSDSGRWPTSTRS